MTNYALITIDQFNMKTKDKILDGILSLLIKKGFTALTVRAVAEEAGVNHGLVQYYFGSKENMVIAMIERESNNIEKKMEETDNSSSPENLRRSLLENFISNETLGKMVLECLHISNTMPAVKEKMAEILSSRRKFLSEALGITEPMDMLVLQATILGLVVLQSVDKEVPLERGMAYLFTVLGLESNEKQKNSFNKG